MAKRYYDENMAAKAKKKANKKEGKKLVKMNDDSLFGFPASSKVIAYPKKMYINDSGKYKMDDIRGMDYQMDMDVEKINNNRSKYRW